MSRAFSNVLSTLRRASGLSQRRAAADLGISQALLSHYENGAREPGLAFICKACDYYGVSADYMLGRSDAPEGVGQREELGALTQELIELAERASRLHKEYTRTEVNA